MTNPHMHGKDLIPLQERLKANGLYTGQLDGWFGEQTGKACKAQKYRLGYPLYACVMTGGQTLLNYLTGATALPDEYVKRRGERGYGEAGEEAKLRARIVANAKWGVANTQNIHYRQSRPIDGHRSPRKLPLYTDCSGFSTDCYEWAGGPDPNGRGFDGLGYTGTMLEHGLTVPLFSAELGDLIVWGSYPGHHVALIVDLTNKSDPLLVSHGSERDPREIRLSQETAAQARGYVVKKYI